MSDANLNQAPFPHELADLVERVQYRPGWSFLLHHLDRGQGSIGLTQGGGVFVWHLYELGATHG